jgi:hypothetical protein
LSVTNLNYKNYRCINRSTKIKIIKISSLYNKNNIFLYRELISPLYIANCDIYIYMCVCVCVCVCVIYDLLPLCIHNIHVYLTNVIVLS